MWIRSAFFVAMAVTLCSCSFSADNDAARNATDAFHRLMDRGDYTVIYDTAAEAYKAAGTRNNSVAFFTWVNRKMGKCGEASVGVGGYQASTYGTFVTMTSSRACANGTLSEQFVWRMVRGKATLVKYNANNPLLLTD
jgi:hypothetical protein